MAAEDIPASLPLEIATQLARYARDTERLRLQKKELEVRGRSLLVLQEIANTLSAELHLPQLLRRIAAAALRLTLAQASAVYLVDETRSALVVESVETDQSALDSGSFSVFSAVGSSRPDASAGTRSDTGKPRISLSEGVAGWVAAYGTQVLVADAANDPRFAPDVFAVDGGLLGMRPQSLLAVPMIFKGGVTGVLEVAQGEDGRGFDATSLDLMRTLGNQAATAVANARLYESLRTERDRIIQTQEDERKRLGRDLHDGPAQKLAQIAMSLEFAIQLAQREPDRLVAELSAIREQALSTTREIRNLLFDLRPLVLDAEDGGLIAALTHFLERFQTTPGPSMHLSADYPDRLSHNVELTIFAIVQEAVNNVLKHANAENCWIDIRETADKLVATIRDDGEGFDVKQVHAEYERRGSWGLLSMLERAALIESRLNISSHPGKGTITALEVPR